MPSWRGKPTEEEWDKAIAKVAQDVIAHEAFERREVARLTVEAMQSMSRENDRVEKGGGCDRRLHTDPPTPEYRQVGWHCVYHEQAGRMCHNPLDCDLIPIWALLVTPALQRLNPGAES